jgi:hypothetical protein
LRLIGWAFAALVLYLPMHASVMLAVGYHPRHSVTGIIRGGAAWAYPECRSGLVVGGPRRGCMLGYYAVREAREISGAHEDSPAAGQDLSC